MYISEGSCRVLCGERIIGPRVAQRDPQDNNQIFQEGNGGGLRRADEGHGDTWAKARHRMLHRPTV